MYADFYNWLILWLYEQDCFQMLLRLFYCWKFCIFLVLPNKEIGFKSKLNDHAKCLRSQYFSYSDWSIVETCLHAIRISSTRQYLFRTFVHLCIPKRDVSLSLCFFPLTYIAHAAQNISQYHVVYMECCWKNYVFLTRKYDLFFFYQTLNHLYFPSKFSLASHFNL